MGKTFLIIIDAHSRSLEVEIVSSTSVEATIQVLRKLFAMHRLPEQLVSDNGTAFTSHQFKNFMSKNGIRHSLTSPYHPRSNGLAERAVQITLILQISLRLCPVSLLQSVLPLLPLYPSYPLYPPGVGTQHHYEVL
uniref:Integrase catalytic domain-containing protein n=1 Tax=Amphimedon queenslandica TaxID=400682 RepID=A0A1X7U5F7_AMPQE